MKPSRHIEAPSVLRSLGLSTAAALILQIGSATPVHAQASVDCFKVCSNLFYKHVNALMKCAYKGRADEAVTTECAAKASAKMNKNYVVKLQPKCGAASCVTAYPSTNDVGCEALVFSTANAGHILFGSGAVPADGVTQSRIIAAGVAGCGYS